MVGLDFTAKPTILVVDDTPDNLGLMSSLLRDAYKVKIANGGETALRIAASDSPPDLILLDIMMPGMDGYEVCQRLKRERKTANIPVIFLTAKADVEDERKGLEFGAVDYITKPISPPIVMARVKNHLALKIMADFLQQTNVELERAKSAAEKANLAKSEFVSSMSHELRSPLNAILGFAQLMESESPPPTPSQKESIAQILQAGRHLLRLINEVLDLAVVESGQISLSPEPVALAEVMAECQAMMEPQARQRGIRMTFPAPARPCFVTADRTRVKQVLINLLSNAIKYNRAQGTVEADCRAIGPERIRISVTNTGAGLPPDKLAQLFQPFNRLGQEHGAEEGTGIGLVMSRRVVELMRGAIGVESTVGVGCVFWIELPATNAPTLAAAGDESTRALPAAGPEGARLRTLLYVEDNPANLALVEQLIARRSDIHLLTAVNGTLGVNLAQAARPDVILMDLNLPGISGIEALKILRADPATAHIPIVALSANAMSRDIKQGLEAGFFHYLTKPIKVTEFMESLDVAFEFAGKGPVPGR